MVMVRFGVCLFTLATCVLFVVAQNPPIYLGGTIRDQAPNTMNQCGGNAGTANGGAGFTGTDFQLPTSAYSNDEFGLVGKECNASNGWYPPACASLGTDLTPTYAYTGKSPEGNIQSPASFYNWFHASGQTIAIPYNITLSYVSGTTYSYINDNFFPINGRGWGDHCTDDNNQQQNFAFCLEAHTRFGYHGTEVFTFSGDDDVWVFIDSRLVIDLGSLHPKRTRSLTLSKVAGLVVGTNYRLDFFYCERHTTESHMELTTSIQFFCAYYDWCGDCEGTGQSCCNSTILDTYCNDQNACTVDSCSVTVSPVVNATGGCVHTPIACASTNKCEIAACDKVLGCQITPLNCNTGDECLIPSCSATTGCVQTSCNGTGCPAHCIPKPFCDDGNPCTSDDIGLLANGTKTCANVLNSTICSDNDVCTNDYCDSSANTTASACSHSTIACQASSVCLISNGCDPVNGCIYTNKTCPGSNDYCTITSCDPIAGCIAAPKVCVVSDPYCFKGVCDNSTATCNTVKVANFGLATNKDGILCVLVYDPTAKKAAIGTGAAVGIAIGAAAAVGIFGYGGKKGYDYIQMMRNQKFDGVQNNPLYEQTNGNQDNPLYRYSTTVPAAQ